MRRAQFGAYHLLSATLPRPDPFQLLSSLCDIWEAERDIFFLVNIERTTHHSTPPAPT